MKAAIVILNYNGAHHLREFLPSVMYNCPDWAKVYVADNGSTDNSIAFLKDYYPDVSIIALDSNYGFSGGYNRALKTIDVPYYAILNSDVEVAGEWLEPLVATIEENDYAVAAQPKIKDFILRDHFEYAGAAGGFMDKYGYPFCRGRLFNKCERDIGQHDDTREIFWASGACLVIKSKIYWEVGGFDEHLFAHMEEIDLCWRLKNRSYAIYCNPAARVYHLGGGTLSAQSAKKTFLNFRNNLSIIVKNDYQSKFVSRLFQRLLLDGLAALYLIPSRGFSHFFAVIRAHVSFYGNLGRLRKERRRLKGERISINKSGYYKRSIVRDYYINKKKVFGALTSRHFIRQDRKK